ncbi:MAG: class I SAM-dependent rRNA methyltransferase [Magnetococcales bacterium]|nr:class I SAM-dependent rRNA methyltransferase [Magnetococcales bacterium]
MPSVVLKAGRDKALLRRHPWIFSGAIAEVRNDPKPGDTVALLSSRGETLGWGAYSPTSGIPVRIWSFNPGEHIDPAFFHQRLAAALGRRHDLPALRQTNAMRLVNAESDGLPGLIVDRYGDFLVVQISAAGPELWRATLVDLLNDNVLNAGIWERSDLEVRRKEGLQPRTGLLSGREPPPLVEIHEGAVRFLVDLTQGQKTGFYLDQRHNRARVGAHAAEGDLLNVFAYSGGFGLASLAQGAARVTQVDASEPALALARQNLALNGHEATRAEHVTGNAFDILRRLRDQAARYDMVVLDPPKFAETAAHLPKASRAYKDVNLLGCQLLRPGGLLCTFSCSGHLTTDLFRKIVADAALDAGRQAVVLERLGADADHPVNLAFPEGEYLKGLICRVD